MSSSPSISSFSWNQFTRQETEAWQLCYGLFRVAFPSTAYKFTSNWAGRTMVNANPWLYSVYQCRALNQKPSSYRRALNWFIDCKRITIRMSNYVLSLSVITANLSIFIGTWLVKMPPLRLIWYGNWSKKGTSKIRCKIYIFKFSFFNITWRKGW